MDNQPMFAVEVHAIDNKTRMAKVFSFGLQLVGILLPAALVLAMVLTLASALGEHSLIVESLSVPKVLYDEGFTGQVIAAKMVDRMDYLTFEGHREIGKQLIQVEPPDTPIKVQVASAGISIDNLYSYARSIISNDLNVSAEIVRSGSTIDFAARLNNHDDLGCHLTGAVQATAKLINAEADCIFEKIEPDRYARYLIFRSTCAPCAASQMKQEVADRSVALADYKRSADGSIDAEDRAWATEGLGVLKRLNGEELEKAPVGDYAFHRVTTYYLQARDFFKKALDIAGKAAKEDATIVPLLRAHLVDVTVDIENAADKAGDDEVELSAVISLTDDLNMEDSSDVKDPVRRTADVLEFNGDKAELRGAYNDGIQWKRQILNKAVAPDYKISMSQDIAEDVAYSHDASALESTNMKYPDVALAVYGALKKWADILDLCKNHEDICMEGDDNITELALAYASSGKSSNYSRAEALLQSTSPVCDFCLRAKGIVYSKAGEWSKVASAFVVAIEHGPDLPVPYEERARYLLQKAEAEGTAAKSFADDIRQAWYSAGRAVSLGPRFADAYEVQGELMVLQSRSDLALEMFQEANIYAPKWKELHLQWAKALHYANDDADAAIQRHEAATLR